MNEGKSLKRAWEEQANEGAQRTRDLFTTWDSGDGGIGGHTYAAGKVFDTGMHVLSPVQTIQSGTQLVKDTGGLLINDSGLSEALTPGTPMSRNEQQKTEMAEMTTQRNQQLQEQQAKIDKSLNSNIMPEERSVLERQKQDIANQISDNNLINQTYEDETADWDLFDQHYIMGGGDYFRDNLAARRDALNKQVQDIQQMSNLPQGMTQLDLENMQAFELSTTDRLICMIESACLVILVRKIISKVSGLACKKLKKALLIFRLECTRACCSK